MIRITIATFTILIMFGCGSVKNSPLVLESDLWVMASDADSYGMPYELKLKDGAPSIEFLNDGKFNGRTCCNSLAGQYTTQDSDTINNINIVIEEISPTLCEHNTQEQYIETLKQIRSYVIQDGLLGLIDSIGTVTLSFIPASTTQK